jgi:hypothetical protein
MPHTHLQTLTAWKQVSAGHDRNAQMGEYVVSKLLLVSFLTYYISQSTRLVLVGGVLPYPGGDNGNLSSGTTW